MARGRPRKTLDYMKLVGTLNTTRHSEREILEPKIMGVPVKPGGLPFWASWLWDAEVPNLIKSGCVKAVDGPALEVMCRTWALYKAVDRKAQESVENAIDPLICGALKKYFDSWEKIASKVGLTPSDRSRIMVPENVGPQIGEVTGFARKRG